MSKFEIKDKDGNLLKRGMVATTEFDQARMILFVYKQLKDITEYMTLQLVLSLLSKNITDKGMFIIEQTLSFDDEILLDLMIAGDTASAKKRGLELTKEIANNLPQHVRDGVLGLADKGQDLPEGFKDFLNSILS